MYVSTSWLKEFVEPGVDHDTLVHRLTMAGLEVGSRALAAEPFTGVVIGRVTECEQHPDADKLRVCQVDIGTETASGIVCGAPNVRAGLHVAVATVGARLPGGLKIRKAKLRGVVSLGMICSARELGMGDEHDGILELPDNAPVGTDLRSWLDLDDEILELELTPNRGDCLGMQGVAREVGALFDVPAGQLNVGEAPVSNEDTVAIELAAPEGCPRYVGRVVRAIDPAAKTPLWMCERLRRAGVRAISPVVDVTNYVLLETGQPLHGFDLSVLKPPIVVRWAGEGETLTLLDGRNVPLTPDVLVIADQSGPLALAGIMGGEGSGVGDQTVDVLFESAWFDPQAVAGRARRFGLHTDASHRYERGVDPTGQIRAIERATELLLAIAGGQAGPLCIAEEASALPPARNVSVTRAALDTRLGVTVSDDDVTGSLERLGFEVRHGQDEWHAGVPPHRFDVAVGEDLVEEVARVYGYERIEAAPEQATVIMPEVTETRVTMARVQDVLVDRGLQEVITYSFVDPQLHATVCPNDTPLALKNPISSDLAVMRASLWPGLLNTVRHNLARQQSSVHVFETGLVFDWRNDTLTQTRHVAFALVGDRYPERWSNARARVDLHDAMGHIEALLALRGARADFDVANAADPALHPGQSANIHIDGHSVGRVGVLHPARARELDVPQDVVLATLSFDAAFAAAVPQFEAVSRFPASRRDVSIVVDEAVSVDALSQAIRGAAGQTLRELRVFDVYRGKGIDSGRKSISFGLILQDSSRTLSDSEADAVIAAAVAQIKQDFDGTIRD